MAGGSKVAEFDVHLFVKKDILGFNVPMDELVVV